MRGSVKVASIDTSDEGRDTHLRSVDFFDADSFPEITFESTRVESIDEDSSRVFGNLTMRGVTREVRLELILQGTDTDPWGNDRAGAEVQGTLNRKDFDMQSIRRSAGATRWSATRSGSRSTAPPYCRKWRTRAAGGSRVLALMICRTCRVSTNERGGSMSDRWPSLNYAEWSETCDTLHAHTQVLGKLAAALAPPEPQLQHAALVLTARGFETLPLPAPGGSGAVVVALDLRSHEAVVEHSDGHGGRVALAPDRAVGEVTREVLRSVRALAGPVEIDPTPQEVWWSAPLDEDSEHATYDPAAVRSYFAAATRAALVLAAFRAPYRGRSTPVNAWWGSFDLAVNLFSGAPADPPSDDFIMRNAMDSQEVAVGWWPGDPRYEKAAFYAYAHPAPDGWAGASLAPAAGRWEEALAQYVLDWDEAIASADPHQSALEFARSALAHSCTACAWDPALAASAQGNPPPIR